ncbi:hypothetical protein ABIF21_000016 [Bradyrhizobium elkanii]|uniref:hypothetical protein n=1 Tax=Bradyrhizobium elkanii TaxID=29448 RepID=UPI00101EA765|nr:hypothetical protein [Bradyrhizobium elkanii]NWL40351.1 hypothetical protein [Bradyrhizobium elkanii]RYM21095.1 hypothetical protein EWH13_28185 [Bradyrhizobium elkanii]
MPQLSLSFRQAFNAEATDDVPIVLVALTPNDGGETVYLSSDPTQRLSEDPLRYGTISKGPDGQTREYEFVLMAMAWPDDQEASPPATSLTFDNVAEDMAATARSVTPGTQADVVMSLVTSSDPDFVEETYLMKATGATYDAQSVSLSVSREPIETEPYPAQRMTKQRFPGQFR